MGRVAQTEQVIVLVSRLVSSENGLGLTSDPFSVRRKIGVYYHKVENIIWYLVRPPLHLGLSCAYSRGFWGLRPLVHYPLHGICTP